MRRLIFVTAFLFCIMAGQAFAADKLSDAVSKIETGVLSILKGIDVTISHAAKETGKLGINRETEIRKLLQNCNADRPYVIDSSFIDGKGIIKFIEPEQYRKYEGSDISKQEAIIKVRTTQKPWMGNVFVSVQGIKSIVIEYPVFSAGNKFLGSVAQTIQAFSNLFAGMSSQVLGSGIYFNAGNNSRVREDFKKRSAILLLLADCFVEKDCATDALAQTGRGHNQFPIGTPRFHGLRNVEPGKTFVAGGIAFIHRQQPFMIGHQRLRSGD